MRYLFLLSYTFLPLGLSSIGLAQKLPGGTYHGHRELEADIQHYRAELSFDLDKKAIAGSATLSLRTLRETRSFSLDAFHLNITRVSDGTKDLRFENGATRVLIDLGQTVPAEKTLTLKIDYSCQPQSGVSFYPAKPSETIVSTFGEGGLHANWLPIYNDLNDKFTTELLLTVPDPYLVVANGELVAKKALPGRKTQFHWHQRTAHSAYLIAFYIGNFEMGELPSVGKVPMRYWVPKGMLALGQETFKNTPRMMEFYNELLDYPYPWNKYDQVAVPGFAPIAMEHTTVTGIDQTLLRSPNASLEFNFIMPGVDWSTDYIIAHELAHHWFGDNLTCHNLSYIWLNESLTTYMGLLWVDKSRGKDQFLYDIRQGRRVYLDYARAANTVRPLEYHYYDNKDQIFDVPITYLKGGVVFHMLRYILGDVDFFRSLRHYLKSHEFSNVVSNDLRDAIEETTGRDLTWFFEQWVTGGGHPHFKLSYRYLPDLKLIDLSLQQTQPLVKGQDLFTLPFDLTIATPGKTWTERLQCDQSAQSYLIPCPEPPTMVSFDGGGSLIFEIDFPKGWDELAYQARNDQLPGRLWAIEQIGLAHGKNPQATTLLGELLMSDAHWSIRCEAAKQLGLLGSPEASKALMAGLSASDYHIRRDIATALGQVGGTAEVAALKHLISSDSSEDVVCAAIVALANADPSQDSDFFKQQLKRKSWNDLIAMACMQAFSMLAKPELLESIKPYTQVPYNAFLRMSALQAWQDCSPGDSSLHDVITTAINDSDYFVQGFAIGKAGQMYLEKAVPKLKAIVASDADATLITGAQASLDEIQRIHAAKK